MDLVPVIINGHVNEIKSPFAKLLEAFLAGKSQATLRSYAGDLQDFASFLHADSTEKAASILLGHTQGEANGLALGYRASLLERKLSAATVNRRLAALRSLVKLGNTLGLVPWSLSIPGVRSEGYRNTLGPGLTGVKAMLEQVGQKQDDKAVRDRAIIVTVYSLGLRRSELVQLDMEDLDLQANTVLVLGKGRSEKIKLTLPPQVKETLTAWINIRGDESGPLFTSCDRSRKGKKTRITSDGIYHLIRGLGELVGIKTRPHGLRHAAITQALDSGADVRSVQRFSRHKDLRIVLRYDDNRQDLGGTVAAGLAAGL